MIVKLTEPSVEHARGKAQERLNRLKRYEDDARSARDAWNRSRQSDASEAARLRALRLLRAGADNNAVNRETARTASASRAAAGPNAPMNDPRTFRVNAIRKGESPGAAGHVPAPRERDQR